MLMGGEPQFLKTQQSLKGRLVCLHFFSLGIHYFEYICVKIYMSVLACCSAANCRSIRADASISAGSFFQVLGVDVIFDGNLNPKVTSPS